MRLVQRVAHNLAFFLIERFFLKNKKKKQNNIRNRAVRRDRIPTNETTKVVCISEMMICVIKGILSRVQNLSRFNKRYVRPPSMLCPWSYYIYNKPKKNMEKKKQNRNSHWNRRNEHSSFVFILISLYITLWSR